MEKKDETPRRRRPVLSGFLSFLSMGLGQVYNGELWKGIRLKILFCLTIGLFAVTNLKSTRDLLWLIVFLSVYILLKAYSIAQASKESRRLGLDYSLKSFNRSYVYILLAVLFLILNVISYLGISQALFNDMSGPHPFRNTAARQRYLQAYDREAAEWPVVSETRMVDGSFGQTFVRISGPEEAPPLVLLPGASANSLMWEPNIEALSESFRTYAVDNIYDFGRSIYKQKIKTPEDFTSWMDELFTSLDLGKKINVAGLSYGGWLTSQYALHYPERVNKIILLAPAFTVIPVTMDWVKGAVLSMIPHPYFIRRFLYWHFQHLAEWDEAGRVFFEEWAEMAFLSMRCFKFKSLVNPTVLTAEEWQSLRMPVLYVVGEHEVIYSPREALERLRNVAPHIKTELIPDAGHDLTILQADLVNGKILEFLKETEKEPAIKKK